MNKFTSNQELLSGASSYLGHFKNKFYLYITAYNGILLNDTDTDIVSQLKYASCQNIETQTWVPPRHAHFF